MGSDFHFLRPGWLLLIPVALLVARMLLRAGDPSSGWRGVIDPHLLEALRVRSQSAARLQPAHLLGPLWLLCALALAGPTWTRVPSPFVTDAAAMVLVVEVGESMDAKDVQPSRLERAAQKVADLLERRPDVDAALFAYAGSVHRVMPLTADGEVLRYFCGALSTDLMPARGDRAAEAIAAANRELARAGRAGSIVLIYLVLISATNSA